MTDHTEQHSMPPWTEDEKPKPGGITWSEKDTDKCQIRKIRPAEGTGAVLLLRFNPGGMRAYIFRDEPAEAEAQARAFYEEMVAMSYLGTIGKIDFLALIPFEEAFTGPTIMEVYWE